MPPTSADPVPVGALMRGNLDRLAHARREAPPQLGLAARLALAAVLAALVFAVGRASLHGAQGLAGAAAGAADETSALRAAHLRAVDHTGELAARLAQLEEDLETANAATSAANAALSSERLELTRARAEVDELKARVEAVAAQPSCSGAPSPYPTVAAAVAAPAAAAPAAAAIAASAYHDDACAALAARQAAGNDACSEDFVALHYACHGAFPSGGTWAGETWVPAGCRMAAAAAAAAPELRPRLGSCLFDPARGLGHLTLLGDSQTMRIVGALERYMGAAGLASCSRLDGESDTYYGPNVIRRTRDCGGCDAFRTQCQPHAGGRPLVVENGVMEFLIDFETTQKARSHWDSSCDFTSDLPCRWAWSTQQLLFQHLLQSDGHRPDHVAVFQNIHDCARRDAPDFARDLRWLLSLINDTLPATTTVTMWEAAALNSAKQPMCVRCARARACVWCWRRPLQKRRERGRA